MSFRVQLRRDPSSKWTINNPVLLEGEIGYETDTEYMKIGDGVTPWISLGYWGGLNGATGSTGATGSPGNSAYFLGVFQSVEYLDLNYPNPPTISSWAFVQTNANALDVYTSNENSTAWVASQEITLVQGATGETGPIGPTGPASYLVYTALLNANSIANPIVLENTLEENITWTKNDIGYYIGTTSNPVFTENKTIGFSYGGSDDEASSYIGYLVKWAGTTEIYLLDPNANPFESIKIRVEIRVYP